MKNYYEKNSSRIIKDRTNTKEKNLNTINVIKKIKNCKTERKNDKINFTNELDYNYLNQTSSILHKIGKSKSSLKKIKNCKNNNKNLKNLNSVYSQNNLILKTNINYHQNKGGKNSLFDIEKLNIISHNNYFNENNKSNIRNTNKNFYGYFPRPEPFPKTINYNFSINNNLKYKNDNSSSKDESNSNKNNKIEDNNILYLLINLNLGNLYNIFMSNYITFNDLFLLSKDDFIEMKIPIGPRNRIMHFLSEYKKFGKKFNFMELANFLNHYKKFMDKPNCNDISFVENIYNKENIDEFKGNFDSLIGNNKKGLLLFAGKSNKSDKNLIKHSEGKDKNIHRLKKYNSSNFHDNKENKNTNNNIIKSRDVTYRKNEKILVSKKLKKYNSDKNNNIKNDLSKTKNNYEFFYQRYNDMNKKVNDFQQNYSKIQKYSKYIDKKISEFLAT